ncbi:MAG: hypothetical protein ACKO37_08435 [Vampirovibrionales bacterium]
MITLPFSLISLGTVSSVTSSVSWTVGLLGIVQLYLQAFVLGVSHGVEPLQWRTLLSIKAIGGPLPKVYPPFMIGFTLSHGLLLCVLAWCVYQGEASILPWFQKAQWLEWLPWLVMVSLVLHSGWHWWESLHGHDHRHTHEVAHHSEHTHTHEHPQTVEHSHGAFQAGIFQKGMSHILSWFQAPTPEEACEHFGGGSWFKPALLIGLLWGMLPCPITVSAFLTMTTFCHTLIHTITQTQFAHTHLALPLSFLTQADQAHTWLVLCLAGMVIAFLMGVGLAYTVVLCVGTSAGHWCMVRLRWWKHRAFPALSWEQFSLGVQFGCWLLLAFGLFVLEFAPETLKGL